MILCSGEALIDMVPVEADGQSAFLPVPGGSVFNTAIALGRLETPTAFFYGISTDLFGRQLRAALQDSGVEISRVSLNARPTTLAFVELNGGQASYSFYDENSAGRMMTKADLPQDLDGIDTLYFGGISLCVEPVASVLEEFHAAHCAQHLVMLDPNIRPDFIADEALHRDRLSRMIIGSDIIKVSDEDLHWLFPGGQSVMDKLRHLAALGPSICILTKGAKGAAALIQGEAMVEISSKLVEVCDTIGAGDSFNAGFLAKLRQLGCANKPSLDRLNADQVTQALAFAAEVAAVTVSRQGANPPRLSELT